jgi:hypothetical protein
LFIVKPVPRSKTVSTKKKTLIRKLKANSALTVQTTIPEASAKNVVREKFVRQEKNVRRAKSVVPVQTVMPSARTACREKMLAKRPIIQV